MISELFARVEGFSVFIFLFMYYRDDEEQTKPLAPFFVIFSPPNFAIKRRSPKSERMMRSLSWMCALLLLSLLLSSIGEGVIGTIPRGARTTATTTGAAFVEEGEDRLFSRRGRRRRR